MHGVFKQRLRDGAVREAEAACARARARAGVRGRARWSSRTCSASDFTEVGAEEPYSEGIIDYLRQSEGAQLVALIREPPEDRGGPTHRISLRSSSDEVDVSAIARASGGGGHLQAAGFSSDDSIEEIIDFIRREFVAATAG